ncbi:HypC/HybG/HupF family hydrogenase formation chaperone [Patescibacteria group bacterium]|nr:HypC/HybG/HupF family hydrogenase formation chaperone [Patescibacteria group bacterium]
MCLAFPGKIKKIEGKKVLLDYPEDRHYALIGDEKVKVGDYVMVQMGIIVKILSQDEAKETFKAWNLTYL